jgi:5-methyltetrahydrofolate--homocysteine methyltransferase
MIENMVNFQNMKPSIDSINRDSLLLADGAWGTQLQNMGLEPGDAPERWNMTHREQVADVARSYVEAGASVVITNTFGANLFVLRRHGLEEQLAEINRAGADISVEAAGGRALVFGAMGPTGKLLATGEVSEKEIYESYQRQSAALWEGGVDALLIETMIDLDEMILAARASRDHTPLPLVLSMTFDSGKTKSQTMMGVTPERAVEAMESLGAWMVGANCGLGPEHYVQVCEKIRRVTDKPIWIKANAGIPQLIDGAAVYPQNPHTFARYAGELQRAGANVIGGCCGTTPAHIAHLRETLFSR